MAEAAPLMDQGRDLMNAGRYGDAAQAYMAAIRAAPGNDEAWLGLGLAVAVQRQFALIPTLAAQRQSLRADGFIFFHDLATMLMTYRLHPLMLELFNSLPEASPYLPSAMYFAGCCHLLAGHEDEAFTLFGRLKPLLAAGRDHLPIGPEHRFNIAYRQATLIEDADYVAALSDAGLATVSARLPQPEPFGTWHAPVPGQPVLLAACDGRYLDRFAGDFLASITRHGPGSVVHLHVVEPGPGGLDAAARLATEFPNIRLNLSSEPANPLRSGAYYACSRFLVAPWISAHWQAPVLITDIDIVFERALTDTIQAANTFDFASFVHDGFGPCSRRPAVLTWFAATPQGQAAQQALRRFILSKLDIRWPLNWMLDQAGLMAMTRWLRHDHPDAAIGDLTAALGGSFLTVLSCRGDADEKARLIKASEQGGLG